MTAGKKHELDAEKWKEVEKNEKRDNHECSTEHELRTLYKTMRKMKEK